MVFISMEQDAALQRTVEYHIQYPSSSTSTASSTATAAAAAAAARDRVTFTNTDPRTRFNREPQQTLSISHNQDGTLTTHAGRSYIYGPPASTDTRAPHMPHEFTANQPDFRISTDFSDDDDDAAAGGGGGGGFTSLAAPPPGVPVSILRRPPPNRIGTLPFENEDESDSELESGYITNAFLTENTIRRLRRTDSDTAVRRAASTNLVEVDFEDIANSSTSGQQQQQQQHSPALAEAWDAHVHATHEALRAVGGAAGGSLLAPHARFHIEKKKRKCTIRFDPPVFGRFILLKMWSPQHDPGSNIDIQSVLTRGFAGSRFYPAVTMR